LKKLALDLKQKSQVYKADATDSIDQKLAAYINSTSEPFKLASLFVKERSGVYQFGSKKVFVKVEAEKIYGKLLEFIYF
jgi:hypothetical protein